MKLFVLNTMTHALVTCLVLTLSTLAHSQAAAAREQNLSDSPAAAPDYVIGPGDILEIDIASGLMSKDDKEGSDEFGGKFRVSEAGEIEFPAVPKPVKAQGLTTAELSDLIARALQDAEQLRDPTVRVFVREYHSRNVTVLGAVQKPAVYPLQKRTRLLDVLSNAGGLAPNAGNTL